MTKTYKDKDQSKEKKLKFPRGPYRSSWDQVHEPSTRHKRSNSKSIIEKDLEDLANLDSGECFCEYCSGNTSQERLTLKIDYLRGKLESLEDTTIYILQRRDDSSWLDITDQKYFNGEISIELLRKLKSVNQLNCFKNIRFLLNEEGEQVVNCSYILDSGFKEIDLEFVFKEEQWMEIFDSLLEWLACEDRKVNKQWKKYKVNKWQENTQDFINKLTDEYKQQTTKEEGKYK